MKQPTRLLDDPGLSAALRADLTAASRASAAFDERAGLSRLLTAIAAGAAVGAAAETAHAAADVVHGVSQSAPGAGGAAAGAGASGNAAVGSAAVGAGSAGGAAVGSAAVGAGAAGGLMSSGATAKVLAFLLGKGAYWGLAAAAVASVALTISFADGPRPPAPAPAETAADSAPGAGPPAGGARRGLPSSNPDSSNPDSSNPDSSNPDLDPDSDSAPAAESAPPDEAGSGGAGGSGPRAGSAPPAPARSARATGTLAQEVRHLSEMRARLADRPEEVLDGADAGATAFADGALAEERESLAIEALVRLGRRDEARVRAAAFLARHPKSPFAARARALAGD